MSAADLLARVICERLDDLRDAGRYKRELVLGGPQGASIEAEDGPFLNLCANNYLGLAVHPAVLAGAREAHEARGAGVASVRFICGTQDVHRALEREIAEFLSYEDAIILAPRLTRTLDSSKRSCRRTTSF